MLRRSTLFSIILLSVTLLLLFNTRLSVRSQDEILEVVYNHRVFINGESSFAKASGEADLRTGTVHIVGLIEKYIEGYKFWPVSWITKIMTSVMPVVSLEKDGASNLFTLTEGNLQYEARVVMENEYTNIITTMTVTRDGNIITADLSSEGKAQFPEIVGMDEGTMEILQTPNPDGGFVETGRKRLLTVDGEIIEIPYYAEFTGVDLPAPQIRTLSIKLVSASADLTEVELEYQGEVRPAEGTNSEIKVLTLNGQEVSGIIALDRIGVLAREGMSLERVAAALPQFGLEQDKPLSEEIGVFRLSQPLSRAELAKLARQIAEEQSDLVAKAGLLWTPQESETPLIVTDEFVAKLPPGADRARLEALNDENAVKILDENSFNENQFLLAVTSDSPTDVFDMVDIYAASGSFEYVEPNFVRVIIARQAVPVIPNDPLFGNQWHLNNAGPAAATITIDADIDAPLAWSISRGTNAGIVIAVIDLGFDNAHVDLAPNAWVNPGETAGNNIDNDGNGLVDDVNGWDFTPCDAVAPPGPGCGDNTLAGNRHGTAVAGVAAARGDNGIGVSGSCPNCQIMFIRLPNTDFYQGRAFDYARSEGAHVITNSWGFAIGNPCTTTLCGAINNAATLGRGGLGSVVLFAMNNPNVNDCQVVNPDISSIPNVIAVSRSNSLDEFDDSGFGNCMDVLAPSYDGFTTRTLGITTTDVTGAGGYDPGDYTSSFNGTSSATPLTAGVAALLLDVNTGLTRLQVQRLLQDTADKIEPGAGAYADTTGFSAPAGDNATHGYGRINAYEALRVAAPTSMGGRGGVDIFLRDNRLDWGNTTGYLGEQASNTLFASSRGFIPHWQSVDIKVDSSAGGYSAPLTTSAAFDAFVSENPRSSEINFVYVRVHNRGPVTAGQVRVKLQWAFAGLGLPALPGDFWTAFPGDPAPGSSWNVIGSANINNLAYSGSSVAGCPLRATPDCFGGSDNSRIALFTWNAPTFDPAQPSPSHFCLFAVIDSSDDQIDPQSKAIFAPDTITPNDNNVTHRNVNLIDTGVREVRAFSFYVRNPFERPIRTVVRLALGDPELQSNWVIELEGIKLDEFFSLKPGEEKLVQVHVRVPEEGVTGEITFTQWLLDTASDRPEILGGATYEFGPIKEEPPVVRKSDVLWLNHLDLLPGDSSVTTSFNSTSSGVGSGLSGLVIESSTPGDTDTFGGNKVVEMGVEVPPGYEVVGVRVCYELSSSASYITQIRLSQVQNPPASALVMLDDGTDLTAIGPVCVDSAPTSVTPNVGPLLVSLRVNFAVPQDSIVIRGLGLLIRPQ